MSPKAQRVLCYCLLGRSKDGIDTPKALVRARRGIVWVWQDETSLSQRHPCKIQPKIKGIEVFPSETRELCSRVCHKHGLLPCYITVHVR